MNLQFSFLFVFYLQKLKIINNKTSTHFTLYESLKSSEIAEKRYNQN